jgi:hypothetical protein
MIDQIEEPEPNGYVYSWELVTWGLANLRINKSIEELADDDIRKVVRWIGMCAVDTMFIDGDKPILGRIGIGLMLSVTLLEFPEYYAKYELSQFN